MLVRRLAPCLAERRPLRLLLCQPRLLLRVWLRPLLERCLKPPLLRNLCSLSHLLPDPQCRPL